MATETSQHLTGVTYDDSADTVTVNTTVEPWLSFFAALDTLTANNTEQYDVALLLALEQACDGKDTDLNSPVGRGNLPFDGIEQSTVVRSNVDGTETEVQIRKQIYLAVFGKTQGFNAASAVNDDD